MAIQENAGGAIKSRSVRWHVSWGSVFAGFMVFLASTVLLVSLGTACGMTFGDGVPGTLTTIWVAISTLFSLWLGGIVTGQWIEHEQHLEALTNGVMLWSLAFVAFTLLAINGIEMGLASLFGISNVLTSVTALNGIDFSQIQTQLGLTDLQIQQLQGQFSAPTPWVFTQETTRQAVWWSFFGILLSMASVILGALKGTNSDLITREYRMERGESAFRAA